MGPAEIDNYDDVISKEAMTKITYKPVPEFGLLKSRRAAGTSLYGLWAEDHIVPLDRLEVADNPYITELHAEAPTSCAGAVCFQQVCSEGFKVGHKQGDCCNSC